MTPRIAAVIPARYASSRFPGKPLALLHGRAMIVHVCERVAQARLVERLWVATDDERIACVVTEAGFEVRMTPADCASGTDRIAASLKAEPITAEGGCATQSRPPEGGTANKFGGGCATQSRPPKGGTPNESEGGCATEDWDIIVNVQGDEPQIDPSVIDAAVQALLDAPDCGVSTVAVPIHDRESFESPHVVKVVLRPDGQALYFSRSPLPSPSRVEFVENRITAGGGCATCDEKDFIWGLKHLGLYVYRREVLLKYATWKPTPLEERERLEQLRFLEKGIGIQVAVVEHDSIGVDTPEELEKLNLTPVS